ncbi:hypothetical protein DSM16313_26610 [Acinetobacter seohaensis]|nr:hypothetical protein DSM16313_26610 [Acinetobacter seohaensis]
MCSVKVVAKVVDDDSGIRTEIPILLDHNKEPIKPIVRFQTYCKKVNLKFNY